MRVVAPAAIAWLGLQGPRVAAADGRSPAEFTLAIADSFGVPVGARTLVTLATTLGHLTNDDLDPNAPGIQVAVEGGRAQVELLPPAAPGRAQLTAASGTLHAAAEVEFLPEMRPLLAVGMVEGVVTLDGVHGPAHGPTPRSASSSRSRSSPPASRDGSASAAARAALFMKGRVRDDLLLTLGYDSDRPSGQRPFRDIQPDAFYPMLWRRFGARLRRAVHRAALRAARSPRRLAAVRRLRRPTTGGEHSLAAYSRSLTGVAEHFGRRRQGGLDAFASRDRSHQRSTSWRRSARRGPTRCARPVLENSERVEIVTRDRDQPASCCARDAHALHRLRAGRGSPDASFHAPVPFDAA